MNWLKKDDAASKKTLEQVTQLRIASNLWSRVTRQSEIDDAQVS